MSRFSVATVLCLMLSLQCRFIGVQGSAGDLGEECNSGACTNPAHKCDTNRKPQLCKIIKSGVCTSNSNQCVAGATCSSDVCTCSPTNAASNNGLCDPMPGYVGDGCGGKNHSCLDPHAACKSEDGEKDKCVCKHGFVVNYIDYTCAGAVTITTSVLLLTLAVLVTSRLV